MAFQAARLDGTSWRGGCTPVLTGGREAGEKRKDSWEKQCILNMMFRHVSHVFLFLFSGLCGAVVNAQDQIIPRPVSVRVEAKGAATPVKLDEGMRIVCREKSGEFRRRARLLQQFLSRGTGLALEGGGGTVIRAIRRRGGDAPARLTVSPLVTRLRIRESSCQWLPGGAPSAPACFPEFSEYKNVL